jgi:hypothetical protein
VLADGLIRHDRLTGSIHLVARTILHAPCNGWTAWYYEDGDTGERKPIDLLREQMRLTLMEHE